MTPVFKWTTALTAVLAFGLPVTASSQSAANSPAKKPPTKSAVKPSASRVDARSQANQMATGFQAADAALTPGEMAVAERVYQGNLPCDDGAAVTLTPDAKTPGYFALQLKTAKYRMFPVETTTGTIRLEDQRAGVVWLQLANKSMLMNQKLGQRLADGCMSPAQSELDLALQKNPALSVLDVPDTK